MRNTLLHLGIAWEQFPDAWVRLQDLQATLLTDRWDAWGEPLQRDPQSPFAHVIVLGPPTQHDSVVSELADHLCGDAAGTWIAAETTLDDWSVHDAGGRIWHRLDAPTGPVIVVEVHPWVRDEAGPPPSD